MEVAVPIDEEEALRNIQSQNETVYDSVTTDVQVIESDETVIAEDGGVAGNNNRGDEGLLEGVAVGNIDAYCSDSDDDEEEETGIVIHAGRATTAAPKRHTPHFDRSSKVYLRPQALTPSGPASFVDSSSVVAKVPVKDETKRLRFSHHRTAFDVDIENLESHPWRNKNVDLSDYFNYGFSEATWQLYSERQLLLRGKLGLGPYHPAPVIASLPVRADTVSAIPAASSSAAVQLPAASILPPIYAPAAILPQPIMSLPPAPAPMLQPPRPMMIPAPTHSLAPPIAIAQPPPPRRAPPSLSAPEAFTIPFAPALAPALAPAPPVYIPTPAQPAALYIQQHHQQQQQQQQQQHQQQQQQQHPGAGNWQGMMPGISPMNMGGPAMMGMGWDAQSMPPHLAALGGYGFPGQGGMIPPYGMALGGMMPGGMMSMDGQGQGFMMEEDMRGEGYHDRERYRADEFYSGRADSRGFEQGARDSRYDAPGHDRHGAVKHQDDDRRRGERERERAPRNDRDREKPSRDSAGDNRETKSSSASDRKESNEDDRDKGKKRRRDGDDESSRSGRDRGRESDRNSKGERDVDRRRR